MIEDNVEQITLYQFAPRSDITLTEVVNILSKMNIRCTQDVFDRMPKDLGRHFTVVENKIPQP